MRRDAAYCLFCFTLALSLPVRGNERFYSDKSQEPYQQHRQPADLNSPGVFGPSAGFSPIPEGPEGASSGLSSSPFGPPTPSRSNPSSRYNLLDKLSTKLYETTDLSSDESTQDDHSVSDDAWSTAVEPAEEDPVTDADLNCAPSKFLSPVGHARSIGEASELLLAFKAFAKQSAAAAAAHKKKKMLIFVTAGTGEELIGNRQISQRLLVQPTVRKKRTGFFNPSDGVAELSDDGRLQVELLHELFTRFVKQTKDLPAEQRRQACVDVFLTSTLQSGVETCLEVFTGILEPLSCHGGTTSSPLASSHADGYLCSSVRFVTIPHLREVVETAGDIGESLPVVLKKTKNLRVQNGFQRDVFDCIVANYGMWWKKQQLGALGTPRPHGFPGSPRPSGSLDVAADTGFPGGRSVGGPVEAQLAALEAAVGGKSVDTAALKFMEDLDRLSYPKGFQCSRRLDNLVRTFSFLKESARQEPSVQRAVWAMPEEMESDYVESDGSVLRRGLSLLRSLCAVQTASRFLLTSHPKFVERLTGQPMDNGELMAFTLDCSALSKSLQEAGFIPWEENMQHKA